MHSRGAYGQAKCAYASRGGDAWECRNVHIELADVNP
jgi:hypothetical protein